MWSATTSISSLDMCFILKKMDRVERHITMKFVLKDQLLMSLKLTTMESCKRSLNCNIIASRIKFFYSNVIGMIPLTKKSKYILIMVWSKLIQRLDSATSMMFLFSPSYASKFITYTPIPLERIVQELIGYL
jgi:hypothetical protein